jgi:hypothetical protein
MPSSLRSQRLRMLLSARIFLLNYANDDQSVTLEFCVMDTGIGIAKDK